MVTFEVADSWNKSAGFGFGYINLMLYMGIPLFQGGGREPEELDAWIVDQVPLSHGSLTWL